MYKHLVTDVDGVLTDGGFYYSAEGKIYKKFGPHDNDGFNMIKQMGINPIAITADKRGFSITRKRLQDMSIECFLVPSETRYEWIKDRVGYENIIFIGDGYFDIPAIKSAAYGICPKNAPPVVQKSADLVTVSSGGNGVILEVALEVIKNV